MQLKRPVFGDVPLWSIQ